MRPDHRLEHSRLSSATPFRPVARIATRAVGLLALLATLSSTAHAKHVGGPVPVSDATLQIFIQLDGTPINWTDVSFTVAHVQVEGKDAAGRAYSVALFDGAQLLSVPRAAIGSPRLLVSGNVPPGRVSQVTLDFDALAVTTDPAGQSTSPRNIPPQLGDKSQKLQFDRPLAIEAAGTVSLATTIALGQDLVIGKNGRALLSPVLAAHEFTPVPENYANAGEILTRGPDAEFTELGLTLSRSKILDPATEEVRDLILRKDTGAPASFSELRGENERLWREDHGAISPELATKLAPLGGSDEVLADLFLRVPGDATFITAATTPALWDIAHSAWVAARRAAALPIANAVTSQLVAAGVTVLGTELSPPLLHIKTTRSVLQTVVSQLADVLEIVETPPEPAVLAAQGAVDLGQEPLWLAHLLLAGQGLRIAIVEPQACINTVHEAFRDVTVETPVAFPCSETTGNSGHSTAVASCAGAAIGPSGSIQLVGLFQGHMLTSDIGAVTDALLQRNPHLINCSFEISQSDRRKMDYVVYSDRIFIANGSGNIHSGEDPATQPVFGFSYNSLCVGGYNHQATLGPGNYGDDTVAGRWLNDAATHREKPDVVGPYAGSFASWDPTKPTDYDPWGGTSFSTPMVVGTAALLMANFPQELTSNPTLLRATLMASASHAIEGNPPIPIIADAFDDRSGAGAPRGDRARKLLNAENFYTAFVDRAANFTTGGDLSQHIEIHADPGDKVRVVLTYDQCQDATTSTPDALLADLDLIVTEGYLSGATFKTDVHVNNSHVDNNEIVEFVVRPGHTGINVKVHSTRWDPCTDGTRKTYVAIAWDVMHAGEQLVAKPGNPELTQRLEEQSRALSTLDFRTISPNPFAGSLHMEYVVPSVGGDVRLRVFDLAGRLVAQPVSERQKGGVHAAQWNATARDGRRLAPGVYLVQLQMGPKSVLRRVVLTR